MSEIKQFSLSASNTPYLFAKISALDLSKGYVANVTIRKSSRSIEQNSRLWKLYSELGLHIGEHPNQVHELMGYQFLRYQDTINGLSVELIKSTTKLNVADMAKYQEQIEQWASQIGFFFEREAA